MSAIACSATAIAPPCGSTDTGTPASRAAAQSTAHGAPAVNLNELQILDAYEIHAHPSPRRQEHVGAGHEVGQLTVLGSSGPDGLDASLGERCVERLTDPVGDVLYVDGAHVAREVWGVRRGGRR